jgi:hypothetical protein
MSPMRASDTKNVVGAEESRDHVHLQVGRSAPITNLLRHCIRALGAPSDDLSASSAEVPLLIIIDLLDRDEQTYTAEIPFLPANRVPALRIAAEQYLAAIQRKTRVEPTPVHGDAVDNSQLPGVQVQHTSAFQTFVRHFKQPLSCSRSKSGIGNENEQEPAGEEVIGNCNDSSMSFPERTLAELSSSTSFGEDTNLGIPQPIALASSTSFVSDLFIRPRKRQISALCQHGRQKSRCKECGGSSICEHSKLKQLCAQCDGSSLCSHLKRKWTCRECKGSSLCIHGRRRTKCPKCKRPTGVSPS